VKIEIWSDVACPWCYIGKRRFESALADFEHRDQVEISWRSFELAPDAPATSDDPMDVLLSEKYGMSLQQAAEANAHISKLAAVEGLEYHLELTRYSNTFNAHRLIHLAEAHGLQDVMKERLLKAYFTDGLSVGDIDTLVLLASELGLDGDEARTVLNSDTYAAEVREDEQLAKSLGVDGVPFFVIDEKYGISGAQPSDVFLKVLKQSWTESHPLIRVGDASSDAGSCGEDACAI
jgi:predicted DsbA family dithiol-disulfide isomerase